MTTDHAVRRAAPGPAEICSRQIAAVHEISRQLSSTLDLDERLQQVLLVSIDVVNATSGTIFLYRASDDKLVFQHVVGPVAGNLTGLAIGASDGVAGAVFQSGEPQITHRPRDVAAHRADIGEQVGFVTEQMVTVPLKYQAGSPIGVMQILNKRGAEFDASDLEVLEIVASVAAAAIENAQLHREAQLSAVAHTVGDLSHDIKNKMTPISMAVDTLWPLLDEAYAGIDRLKEQLPAEQMAALDEATGFLRGMYPELFSICKEQLQEAQDFTKLIADALKGIISKPQMDPNDLNELVDKQVGLLKHTAREKKIGLECDLGDIPACRFDRFLMERAVHNLVNNAIPETPPDGLITIRTSASAAGEFPEGGYVLVEVADTGRGMPPNVLDRILNGDAKSTKPGGTGLGTRIVYNAVAAHHGRFEGETREGEGTTFRLRIPFLPA